MPSQLRQQHTYMLKCFKNLLQYEGHLDLMLTTEDPGAPTAADLPAGGDEAAGGATVDVPMENATSGSGAAVS